MPSIRQLFLRHLAQTSPEPLGFTPVRGEGIYLYDQKGNAHIDLISGIGVSALGHRHPDVLRAIREQSELYLHTMVYGEHIVAPQVQLARRLTSLLPPPLDSVYFVNSGSEAVEGAMKLAKRFTGRPNFISLYDAYHGSSHGPLSLMSNRYFTGPYHPLLPGVSHIHQNNVEELDRIDHQTAGVILETVQGEAGCKLPDPSWLKAVRERCDETGALLILDEIQAGMGRTGKLWAFEHYGIVPDILLTAKAFGGGLPLGAFAASRELMQSLSDRPVLGHITTFGGNPLCCAAAHASLDALIKNDLIDKVEEKEKLFREELQHDKIRAIHGRGLMLAAELESFEQAQKAMFVCMENGLLTDWFLYKDNCLRIAPPLIIREAEIVKACRIIRRSLDKV